MGKKLAKLYYREGGDGRSPARRLDKLSPALYNFIGFSFTGQGAEFEYRELNKDVDHWTKWKPITLYVPVELHGEVAKLKGGTIISVSGTWRPLCILSTQSKPVEVVKEALEELVNAEAKEDEQII